MRNHNDWDVAAQLIRSGKLVVFPTDTVYGIGCDAYNPSSIDRIYAAKGRSTQKSIPLLLSSVDTLSMVAQFVPQAALVLGTEFWPGAMTLVVPRRPDLPPNLSGTDTIAVRVPNHDALRDMIAACGGAIAATSANQSGLPDATDADSALRYFGDLVAMVIDGGPTPGGIPSTVVDCTVSPPRILREGVIPGSEVFAALAKTSETGR
jgi:tRNA threonylcarbamoyl adenosine modification protein (Sua5/YciO/YrdC/YwlC family)